MKQKRFFISTFIILCMQLHAQNVPDGVVFLPEPPSSNSMMYVNDMIQYYWGKSVRDTERGQQAAKDIPIQISTYANAFSEVIGLTISEKNTPAIYNLFDIGLRIGEMAAEIPQNYYRRVRPYVRFDEASLIPTDEKKYANVGSYPSVTSMMGWLCALMLAEVCPTQENQILTRGYDFGFSSVISGYNWNSDSYAGRLLASAIMSRFHNQSSFNAWITDAQKEYKEKTTVNYTRADNDSTSTDTDTEVIHPYIEREDLPDATIFLPGPPDSTSMQFGYDIIQHMDGKIKRNTSEGALARDDVEYSVDNFCDIYSVYFGIKISKSNTPQIYELLQRVYPSGNAATQGAKSLYKRKRPYVQLIESTGYAPDENHLRYTGSYPSGHASGSWLIALVLSEINPDAQNDMLARAFQYGQGRVITGYHWQSDVDDGRVLASAVYTSLHNSSEFMSQMLKAKEEFQKKTTDVRGIINDEDGKTPVYNLHGMKMNQKPVQQGIYIQGHKKVAIKQ